MKFSFRALSAALMLPVFPAMAVTYQDILSAATNREDLSRQALVTIFGDVVTDPLSGSGDTIIGNMFGLFNGIIAIMAVVWFMFIGLRHIVGTGHQGKVFSADRDIVGTLSIVWGFMSIVPSGNGWSLAQLIMLWGSSVMGVGSANLMVQTAADNIASGYSMTVQPVQGETRTAARAILDMQLCKHAVNTALSDYRQGGRNTTAPMTESQQTTSSRYTVTISNGSALCGSASLVLDGDGTNNQTAIGKFFNPFRASEYSGVVSTQRSAMDAMLADLDDAASGFVSGYLARRDTGEGNLPDMEARIQKAANNYEQAVQNALPKDNGETEKQDALKSYLNTYGWVSLGAWYQTFATANQRLGELAERTPEVSSISQLGEIGDMDLLGNIYQAYRTQLQNTTYAPALGTTVTADEMKAGDMSDPKSAFMKTSGLYVVRLTDYIATSLSGSGTNADQVNPLIKMKNVGDYTLTAAETMLFGFTVTRALVAGGDSSIWGKLVNATTGILAGVDKLLDALSPPVYFLLFLMFSAGFALSVYLPLIPFIFWMTGVGNWIVSVLVGCAAGPLWGATHLGTRQDRGSRAAYGYIYLIDTMIRPPLMVFGFFFASVGIVAGGTILHALFGTALVNVQANSFTGVFSAVGFLLVYARMCTTMVAGLFSLQAYLPDQVISFLGGREASNALGNMASGVKDIIAGSNRNIQHAPGAREDKLKSMLPSGKEGNKDGIQ
ncbi:DotA/TraY family protein [Klebsiella sp. PL-2018]|uniref:DotA/TraY family protein n=1 Tax=Klebsiella TaxID=570 RepID=UPI001C7788A1|nr:DotA/TraY family protein [Klebsiella sp. PL-2018]QXD01002.1 IncI1 plasmid conjugative transfer integral membrane protein TraY [Klebsiella sp. PL-2018]